MKDEILFLYLNGELDSQETKEVEKWILQNPNQFEKIKLIWKASAYNFKKVRPDLSKAWDKINPEKTTKTFKNQSRRIFLLKKVLKYAAVVFICSGLAIVAHKTVSEINKTEWIEYTAFSKEVIDIELPDGSNVTLNQKSKLKYKKKLFSDTREVKLEGEAFFQVKKDPEKPFMIYAGKTTTKVLGTSFNVDAKDTATFVGVTVKSGKVAFYETTNSEKQKLLLTAGETGAFLTSNSKMEKRKNDNLNFLAWKTRIILFDNAPMSEVCSELGAYFDTTIVISQPILNKQNLSARFQDKTLDEILNSLDKTFDIRHKNTKDGIELLIK
jgi:ferric-dicitrate binding protein FerR (iron transport regulator)